MPPRISLKQLHVFISIVQNKTLTEAAQSLFLSKAAVSMALSELEKHIGHPLFDRVNNRLILNQEGQKMLPVADEIIRRSQELEGLFDSDKSLAGFLRIGASDTLGNHVLPYLLSDFRHQTQHRSQSLLISNSAQICNKLLAYELDIGVIEGKSTHPDLISTSFSEDEMCVICAPNQAQSVQAASSVAALENKPWVLREEGSGSRTFFLKTIAPRLENWQEAFQLNTTEALINSVSAGLGFGCLSRLAAQSAIQDGRVNVIPIPLDLKRRFWLVVHRQKYQSLLLKTFIQFCKDWQHPKI